MGNCCSKRTTLIGPANGQFPEFILKGMTVERTIVKTKGGTYCPERQSGCTSSQFVYNLMGLELLTTETKEGITVQYDPIGGICIARSPVSTDEQMTDAKMDLEVAQIDQSEAPTGTDHKLPVEIADLNYQVPDQVSHKSNTEMDQTVSPKAAQNVAETEVDDIVEILPSDAKTHVDHTDSAQSDFKVETDVTAKMAQIAIKVEVDQFVPEAVEVDHPTITQNAQREVKFKVEDRTAENGHSVPKTETTQTVSEKVAQMDSETVGQAVDQIIHDPMIQPMQKM
jgi:hypothetical protein